MSEKEIYDLLEKMHQVEAMIHRVQVYNTRVFGPGGNPHRGQGRVLALLNLQPEINQKDLSYLLDLRQQSLSELLIKLEQKGYITRTPSEEDRRTTVVTLTPAGREAAGQAGQNETDLNRIFNCLSPEEQANFSAYLDRLIQALEKEKELLGDQADWPMPPHHPHKHKHKHGRRRKDFGDGPGDGPMAARGGDIRGPWEEETSE